MLIKLNGKCPLEDCSHHFRNEWGFYGHLFREHLKSELIDYIIELQILKGVIKRNRLRSEAELNG